jgi:hypothetical protein
LLEFYDEDEDEDEEYDSFASILLWDIRGSKEEGREHVYYYYNSDGELIDEDEYLLR